MSIYVCDLCKWEYDEAAGAPEHGIAPGTAWENIPDDSFPQGYYTDAVRWADAAGLLSGTGEAFTPSALCPRADIVTYLYRNLA